MNVSQGGMAKINQIKAWQQNYVKGLEIFYNG